MCVRVWSMVYRARFDPRASFSRDHTVTSLALSTTPSVVLLTRAQHVFCE